MGIISYGYRSDIKLPWGVALLIALSYPRDYIVYNKKEAEWQWIGLVKPPILLRILLSMPSLKSEISFNGCKDIGLDFYIKRKRLLGVWFIIECGYISGRNWNGRYRRV